MRTFGTGATRDSDETKIDPEGFLSPLVIEEFCRYMAKHRIQADGGIRASDNWQKGIPRSAYMKSLWRHLLDLWKNHRHEVTVRNANPESDIPPQYFDSTVVALCAIIFNAQGYLHEVLVGRDAGIRNEKVEAWQKTIELAKEYGLDVSASTLKAPE